MDKDLGRYIGIPWKLGGRDLSGCDCYGLVLLVQRDLFGVFIPDRIRYTEADYQRASRLAVGEMLALGFAPVNRPKTGDLAYAEVRGFGHMAVFIEGGHLTTIEGGASTWKKRKLPFVYYRPEVKTWA